jgi:6-phosphogluconolactonase (cycloisomerase 2 family)
VTQSHVNMAKTNYLYLVFLFVFVLKSNAQLDFVDKIYNAEDGVNGIKATEAVCLSPNGEHLYVGSQRGLSLFIRDTITYELEFVRTYYHQTDGLYQMQDVESIEISCNGNFLLVGAQSYSTIYVFKRDQLTGNLEQLHIFNNDSNNAHYLYGVNSLKLSNNCSFLYAISHYDNTLSVFTFNQNTGELDIIQTIHYNQQGGASFPCSMEMSFDNMFLYVLSSMQKEINVFAIDQYSGLLAFVETEEIEYISNTRIKIAPNGKFLYWFGGNRLSVYERNQETGEISLTKTYEDGVDDILGLGYIYAAAIDKDSKYLFTISCRDSCFSSFEINEQTGFITQIYCQKWLERKQFCGGRNYNSMIIEDDNLLASSYWESSFFNVKIDMETGLPQHVEKIYDTQGAVVKSLRNVQLVETSADGEYVFAATLSDGFSMFKRDPTTGAIEFLSSHGSSYSDSTYNNEQINGLLALDDLLFVSLDNGNTGAICIYRILENDMLEELDFITSTDIGVNDYPGIGGYLIADKSKENIYSAHRDEIFIFDYNSENASISLTQYVDVFELGNINFLLQNVVATNDGEYLFIHNSWGRIYSFKRNIETGHIQFLDEYIMYWYDDKKGLHSMNSASLSNDSKNLYVTFGRENTILSFTINHEIDSLELLEKIVIDEMTYTSKFDYVNLIRVDPSDNYVYTTSLIDAELLLFQRDTITGELEIIDRFSEETDGFDGLDMPSDLTFSNLGDDVYITSAPENAITTLKMGPFLGKDRNFCEGDSITLKLPYEYDFYLWSNGDTSSTTEVYESGKYWVRVNDPYGILDYDTIELSFHAIEEIDLGEDLVISQDSQIVLKVDDIYESYLWNNGESGHSIVVSDSGMYGLVVSNSYGCISSDSIKIAYEIEEPEDPEEPEYVYGLYPNPTRNNVTIVLKNLVDKAEISIYDVDGRFISDLIFAEESQLYLDLSDLAPGCYFVKLKTYEFRDMFKIVLLK